MSIVLLLCVLFNSGQAQSPNDFEKSSALDIPSIANDNISIKEQALENVPTYLKDTVNLDETRITGIDLSHDNDPFSFTTINDDGTKTIFVFSSPIKYEDENGGMRYIDNSLTSSTKKFNQTTYAFENKEDGVKTYFPNTISDGVLLENKGYSLELKPLPGSSEGIRFNDRLAVKTFKEENTVYTQYDDVFGEGYALQYAPVNGGIKENIVIDEYNGTYTFDFEITVPGLKPELMSDQSIEFIDENGEMVFTVGQTFAFDSYEGEDDGNRHITYDCYYKVEETSDGVYLLTSVIDKEFLENPNTVYPVTIDPNIWIYRENMEDCTVYSNTGYPSNKYLTVGKLSGTEYASFVRLKTIQDHKYIQPDKVTAAYYCARLTDASNTASVTISIFNLNNTLGKTISQICGLGLSGLKAGKYGSAVSTRTITTPSTPSDQTFYLDITSSVKSWLKYDLGESGGVSQNYGLILEAANQNNYKQFKSTKWDNLLNGTGTSSYFSLTYTEDTSIANGTYFIKNVATGKYLYVSPSNPTSGSDVVVYPFLGNARQQWTVSHVSNGEYKLKSTYNTSLVLNNTSLSAKVVTDGSTASAQKWRLVKNIDGSTYRIISCYNPGYGLRCGSAINGTTDNADLVTYNNGNSANKWVLEKAITIGGATAYRERKYPNSYSGVSSTDINCYGYALKREGWPPLSLGDSDGVQQVYPRIETYVKNILGRECRDLTNVGGKDALLRPNEYKIAMRVGHKSLGFLQPPTHDYHFMIQLSNGNWAHKQGGLNSRNTDSNGSSITNPSTFTWKIPTGWNNNYDVTNETTFYDYNNNETLYFAVTNP